MNKKIRKILHSNEPYIFLIILLLGILVQIKSGQFFTGNNIVALLGALNGFFIGYLNLNAMIVTLGTASIFQGIMQGTFRAQQLSVIPESMKKFGTTAFIIAENKQSGITSVLPYTFLILAVVCIAVFFMLRYTIFGRGIYAIGGNPASAHAAGFNVKRTKFIVYIIIGIIASVSGICRVCMMQQMHPTNMFGMEMNIIAGVVLGGVALTGGAGTLMGCMLGTFLIILVQNSMILLGIPTTWSKVFVGAIIVIGVAISAYQAYHTAGSKKINVKEAAK